MKNEELYQKAMDAANELHGDTSVSMSETRNQLRSLRDEIDMLIDAVGDYVEKSSNDRMGNSQASL